MSMQLRSALSRPAVCTDVAPRGAGLGRRRRPSICFYTRSADPSGMGVHMLDLVEAFVPRADVWLLCRTTDKSRFLFDGARRLGARTARLPGPHDPAYPAVIEDFLRHHHVDVFHGHAGWGWEDHDGFRVAREQGATSVLLTHHLPFLIAHHGKKQRMVEVVRDVDAQIAVSEGVRRTYQRIGVPAERLTAIPNGVHARGAAIGRDAARAALGLDAEQPVVMTAGRLVKMKGHRYLIEATARLVETYPDLAVVILGDGGLDESLAHWREVSASSATSGSPVTAPTAVCCSTQPTCSLYRRVAGMPLAAIEAMEAGLPVVATRVIGSAEVVVDGRTGSLVPTENPAALASALKVLLVDAKLRSAWGAAGRRRWRAEFTVERMADRTWAVYDRLSREKARTSTALVEA